jgi:uncharacterized protein YqeY
MKLIERIRADRIAAFKAKENIKKNVLGCLIADACKENKEPDDLKVLAVIKKFIEEAEFVKEKVDHNDYEYYKADMEVTILQGYKPAQLLDTEVRAIVWNCIKHGGMDMGKTMKFFKENHTNMYDGKKLSEIVKELL